jgi:hypothetical protein
MRHLVIDGHKVLIDSEDSALVDGFNWRVITPAPRYPDKHYAVAWRGRMSVYMHRLIAGAGIGEDVDHANGNGLDNRKNNLRIATESQNLANAGKRHVRGKPGTSKYKGVCWDKSRSAWSASITVNKKSKHLGRYGNEEEAARAYDSAALAAWGEFARLNFEEGVAVA